MTHQPLDSAQVRTLLEQMHGLVQGRLYALSATPAEFNKKRAAKDHFLTNVLSKPKLFILGDEDELGKAAG